MSGSFESPPPSSTNPNLEFPNVLVVKYRLYAPASGMHGLGLIVFERNEGKRRRIASAIGARVEGPEANLDAEWAKFEEFVMKQRALGHTSAALTKEFADLVSKAIDESDTSFYLAFKRFDPEVIRAELVEFFCKASGAPQQVDFEADYQELTEKQFRRPLDSSNSETGAVAPVLSESAMDELSEELRLECKMVVEPVHGKELKSLSKGDRVLVQITDKREVARYLSKLLAESSSGSSHGISASVVNLEIRDQENIYVRVEFGPGIYGLARSLPSLKVRLVDGVGGVGAGEYLPNSETVSSELLPIIGGIIFAVIVLTILIMVLMK